MRNGSLVLVAVALGTSLGALAVPACSSPQRNYGGGGQGTTSTTTDTGSGGKSTTTSTSAGGSGGHATGGSGGAGTGGMGTGGTGTGGMGTGGSTGPTGCNPFTSAECDLAGGFACDVAGGGAFACYGPPNSKQLCMPCASAANNDFCLPRMTCHPMLQVCVAFCCDDGDCGGGLCDKTVIGNATVGVCLAPDGDGGLGPACGVPLPVASGGSCYVP